MLKDCVKELPELTDRLGVCHFCGQEQMMSAPKKWEQEMLDELATELCPCDAARGYTKKKGKLEKAEAKINIYFSDGPTALPDKARDLLKQGAKLVQEGKIDKITVNYNEIIGEVAEGKEGKIKIAAKKKLTFGEEV